MRYSLTLYALEPTVLSFDQAIRPDALESADMTVFELADGFSFDAKLYALHVEPTPPNWAELLEPGFPGFRVPPSAMAKVVLVIKVRREPALFFFAATFGSGRFLLRSDAYQPGFGLKVALNSVYEGDRPGLPIPSERLRVVQTTTVANNTMRTLKQANRKAAFQDFGVDLQRDQLGRVVGTPVSESWGSRITGSDSVSFRVLENLSELGDVCLALAGVHDRDDFKARFSAIDDIRTVPQEQTAALEEKLLQTLREEPERVTLSPADLLDWDDVSEFKFSLAEETFEEITFQDLQPALRTAGLTLDRLKHERVECFDQAGEKIAQWPIFDALDLELKVDGQTFLLVGGRFYSVAKDYLDELNGYLATIQESNVALPSSHFWQVAGKKVEETEGKYNERASLAPEFALMDKKTVRLARKIHEALPPDTVVPGSMGGRGGNRAEVRRVAQPAGLVGM